MLSSRTQLEPIETCEETIIESKRGVSVRRLFFRLIVLDKGNRDRHGFCSSPHPQRVSQPTNQPSCHPLTHSLTHLPHLSSLRLSKRERAASQRIHRRSLNLISITEHQTIEPARPASRRSVGRSPTLSILFALAFFFSASFSRTTPTSLMLVSTGCEK